MNNRSVRLFIQFLFLICLGCVARPQDSAHPLLPGAAHCLVSNDWLAAKESETKELPFAYFVDRQSYSNQTALYVVAYSASNRSRGYVFTIFVEIKGQKRVFNIQNNANFVTKQGHIEFANDAPPLGGTWTQQHIVAAIKKMKDRPTYIINIRDAKKPLDGVQCTSYVQQLKESKEKQN